jgi:hypothetical protein
LGVSDDTINLPSGGITEVYWDDVIDRPTKLSQFTDDIVAGKYLPLNTSTTNILTSSDSGVLNFKSTSSNEVCIRLYLGGTNGGGLWYHPNNGIYLYNGNTGRELGIKDDGTPFYGDYTLYHTGNLNLSNYHAKGNELTIGDGTGSIVNLQIKGSTSMMSIMSFSNGTNYIESHTKDGANAPLKITGNGANLGSDLYLFFNNIYCRGSNYVNIDSGNYSSYALPLGGGTLSNNGSDFFTINRKDGWPFIKMS